MNGAPGAAVDTLVRMTVLLLALSLFGVPFAQTAPAAKHPPVWAMPPSDANGIEPNAPWADLFAHPDQWTQTRSEITVLGTAQQNLGKFSDADLRAQMQQLKDWNLKLGLEVGAIKEWGQDRFRGLSQGAPELRSLRRRRCPDGRDRDG